MSRSRSHDAHFEQTPLRMSDVVFKAHPRACRYVAKIDRAGNILLTVPRLGNKRDALSFANSHREWLKQEQARVREDLANPELTPPLRFGDWIWFRGERTELRLEKDWGRPVLCFGKQRVYIADEAMDLTRPLKEHLKELAKKELPTRLWKIAERLGNRKIRKVVIRDQRTRWGSCSTSGTISLNWRLILAPPATRDYVIIHEFMHTKRFDHSPKFWALVEAECPTYRSHENWLRKHQEELNW